MKIEFNVESERSFWRLTAIFFVLVAALNYFPVLVGKVPFPRDLVLQFPMWGNTPRTEAVQRYPNIGDLVTQLYPFRALTSRSVSSGTLPLWNPQLLSGTAFLGSPQSSLFYPPNFFYYVLPMPIAWTVCIMARLFLAAMFMTLFVRSVGASRAGAVFSGIVFSSCGFLTAWQGFPMGDAAIWLPAICYAVHRLHNDRSGFSLALAGVVFTMPVLAGHPETAAHVTLVALAVALLLWPCSTEAYRSRFDKVFLFSFVVAGILALGLASIQMIPSLEWLHQLGSPLAIRWPLLPLHQILGLVSRDISRASNSAGISIPEAAGYVGMITLLAASLAPLHHARKYVVFLAVLTLASLGVAFGVEPIQWLAAHTPVFAGLKNSRMILVADFGLAALAGLGISVLQRENRFPTRTLVVALCLLIGGFLLSFLLISNLQSSTRAEVDFLRSPSFSMALLFAGIIPIVLRLFGILRGRSFAILACGLAAVDLITFSHGYTGFARPHEIFPAAPAFEFLAKQSDARGFRIAQIGEPYRPNMQMMYGLSAADGYEVRLLPTQRIFTHDFTDDRLESINFTSTGILGFSDRRLDMLNLKYLVFKASSQELKLFNHRDRFVQIYNDENVVIVENKSVLPRAFAVPVSGIEVLSDVDAQLDRLRDPAFNPEHSVILPRLRPALYTSLRTSGKQSGSSFESRVEMLKSGINEFVFRTHTSDSAVLVLSQTFYPGWNATVDDKEVPVFAANMILTGIALPSGEHDVRFVLRPMSFRLGAVLTILSAVIIGGLFAGRLVSNSGYERRLKFAAAAVGIAVMAVSAVALSGNLDRPPYSGEGENTAYIRGDILPFEVASRPPSIEIIAGTSMLTGHARLEPTGSAQVSGLEFLTYRKADRIISEAVIPSMTPVTAGLLPLRLDEKYKTAVAILNPGGTVVNVTSSTTGGSHQSAFGIPPNGQITAFLDGPPFNIRESSGTFKFQSDGPVAVVALLTSLDPFLMAPVPMAIPGSSRNGPVQIPYVTAGAGWSTELVLLNPTATPMTGHHRWYTASGELTDDVPYSIPPEMSLVYKGASPPVATRSSHVEVTPGAGQPSPEATAMLFLEGKQQSGLISIAGVTAGLNAFVYAAAPGLRNTQIAVANPSGKTVRVKAGSDVSVPAHGIVIVEPKEPGVITVSAESPVAVTVLRNLLVSDTPRLLSSYPANLPSGLFFPNFASGGGFDSTFVILHRDETTALGQIRFFGPSGSPLQLSMLPR
ncbi:MAG TPA: YfhO family protein [Terriglobia bacterium]|nr:YfhO family protein [Terriglobia bacterium]